MTEPPANAILFTEKPSKRVGYKILGIKRGENMKLSTKGRYGLRALVDLATYSKEDAVSLQSIAQRQQISERYLEQLMRKLKTAGLVTSVRGAGGGYRLAKPSGEISVGDVLRALEGDLKAVDCTGAEENQCESAGICVTRYVWEKINDSIRYTVDSIMLDQLVQDNLELNDQNPEGTKDLKMECMQKK